MDFRDFMNTMSPDDSDQPHTEPSAADRQAAISDFQVFRAHVDAGFTEGQAMRLLMNERAAVAYSFVANHIDPNGETK